MQWAAAFSAAVRSVATRIAPGMHKSFESGPDAFSYERLGETFVEERQAWHAWTRWQSEPAAGVPPEAVEDGFLLAVLGRIETDLSVVTDLDTVARQAGLSPFHFHRRFAETMGETLGAYTRRIRLEHAATIICRTSTGILDAALRTGYNSQPAFTRAFSRRFGMTPSRMRAMVLASTPAPRRLHHDLVEGTAAVRQPAARLIAMRFHGGLDLIPYHWRRFARALQAAGVSLDGLSPVGILYDDPALTGPERMRYDCAIIDPGLGLPALRAPFRRLDMREGFFASLDLAGPQHLIAEAIFGVCVIWLPRARRGFGETPAYVIYRAPPWETGHQVAVTVRVPTDR